MQQKQHALNWFYDMVDKGAMNPLNPDLSLVPMDILSEIYWDTDPDGEVIPSGTAANVSGLLFIACLYALERQKGQGVNREVTVRASEAIPAMKQFLILAGLEILRRDGLLNYHTSGGWHNGESEILISDLKPDILSLGISPPFKTFYNFN
ncbi:MAG: hypothetical protein R2860_17180 [Desulfobacterales bacterium]